MRSTRAAEAAPFKRSSRSAGLRACPRPVIRNASKEHASTTGLLRICKASLAHQTKDSALGIVFHAIAGVKQVSQEAMRGVLGAFEVEHVKLAAGLEDAAHRTHRLPFFVRREVVEHERRKYAIEPRLGIRKLVSKSLIELDGDPCARCFASGAGQSLGVGIKSNHFDVRIKLLDQRGQSARPAAHVENALTRPQRRLLEQRLPSRVTAKQLHYRIVERQRPIVSSRREISSRRFHHGFDSCALVIPLEPLSFRGAQRLGICSAPSYILVIPRSEATRNLLCSFGSCKNQISRFARNDNNKESLRN